MSFNSPVSPYVELARAIALANLEPPAKESLALLGEADPLSRPVANVAAYAPFVDEIARALRERGPRLPSGRPGDADPTRVYRRAYGITTPETFRDSRSAVLDLLSGWFAGGPQAFRRHGAHVALRLDIDLEWPAAPQTGESTTGRRASRHRPFSLRMAYIAAEGRDAFVYGVLLAADAGILTRLSTCVACGRFILGKTDRLVRYCAHEDCRAATAARTSTAPASQGAAYQRRHRMRQADWLDFDRGRLASALRDFRMSENSEAKQRAREDLERAIADGHVLLPECFPRENSALRIAAAAQLARAEAALSEGL